MIATLLRVSRISLSRDRVAQAMSFLLPIAFFSIFALVFGQQQRAGTRAVRVALVDEDSTEVSRRLVQGLGREKSIRLVTTGRPAGTPESDTTRVPLDRARAEQLVRSGQVPVALILPPGLGEGLFQFGQADSGRTAIDIVADVSDPIAPQVVNGVLQKTLMTGLPDLMIQEGMGTFDRLGAPLTAEQQTQLDRFLPRVRRWSSPEYQDSVGRAAGDSAGSSPALEGIVPVHMVDLMREEKKRPMVSFYAAGIGVMFLLFSCAGAGGALLEEVESGTLERVLSSRVGMTRLLLGKWIFLLLLGTAQLTLMFGWGALVFHLDLLEHIPGFLVMTLATAAAAAGFGILLSTLARSRAQLGGMSTIVILIMSALGGSMFPRFLMSDAMQKLGLFTFNGWALDGFTKVFWRDAKLIELWPQVTVLCLLALAFLGAARLSARRWESV